jgi:conjugal transfer pilus assembly protein TraE
MNVNELSKEIAARTGIKQLFMALLAASILGNVLMAFAVITADRTHRETLIPPTISRSFWVEDTKVSNSYLEEMGLFVIRNALDVTPISADFQHQQILKYANPQSFGVLQKELAANAMRMKELNVSTFFSVTAVTPNEAKQQVAFHGILSTMLGDKIINTENKVYSITFGMSNGKIHVSELRETSTAQPFEPAASAPK